jgi:amino acid adenylation domain-containing protein
MYLACARHFSPFAVQWRIDGAYSFPPALLETAVGAAAVANPGARLVPDGRSWVDSGLAPRVSLIEADKLLGVSHPALERDFSFDERPPIELLYVFGHGLIFRCSHALMDAGGLRYFAEETFRALRGDPLLGSTDDRSEYDYLVALRHPRCRPLLLPDRLSPLGAAIPGATGFVHAQRTIPGHVTSVGAKVCAALVELTQRFSPGAAPRFMLPVDLRKTDSGLRSPSNLSNPLFMNLSSPDWVSTYRKIIEAMDTHDERAFSSLDRLCLGLPLSLLGRTFDWLHARQVKKGRYLFSAAVSHVGPVKLAAFSAQGVVPRAIALLPFDAPGAAMTLISVQHDNGLEIAASCPAATAGNGRLTAALDRICEALDGQPAGIALPGSSGATYGRMEGRYRRLPQDPTVGTLITQQIERYPDRTALSEGALRLSFGDLGQRSAAMADSLRRYGVGPGHRVAILSGRSAESVVALLALLQLGAAFVPIDPRWPTERIRLILDDCQPVFLLTDEKHSDCVAFSPHLSFASLQTTGPQRLPEPCASEDTQRPVYMLYTSGSTGKPKGVVVGEQSLRNYLLWAKEAYLGDMEEPTVFPLFTSLSFDLTLTSIFLPLISGGEIRVFVQEEPLQAIQAILTDPHINAIKLTPSHLRIFSGLGIGKSGLRKLIVGGEALSGSLAAEVLAQRKDELEIFNEYGPTEATIGCIMHQFDPLVDHATFVPIGQPIANTEILVLDQNHAPVADGEIGEIYIAGACLAIGYHARPIENQRFVTHPLQQGSRMYRTGDLAVRLPNGDLDYRGRIDAQVKILGYRIELGEIEATIESSEMCNDCAVLVEEYAGVARLAGFVQWRGESKEAELMEHLGAQLPPYMQLSRVISVDQLPLTVNGKVDKSQLSTYSPSPLALELPPLVGIEAELVQMVNEVTEGALRALAAEQSLLELGLDSFQMMLLLTAAADRFLATSSHDRLFAGVEPFLRDPSVRHLAKYLRTLGAQ